MLVKPLCALLVWHKGQFLLYCFCNRFYKLILLFLWNIIMYQLVVLLNFSHITYFIFFIIVLRNPLCLIDMFLLIIYIYIHILKDSKIRLYYLCHVTLCINIKRKLIVILKWTKIYIFFYILCKKNRKIKTNKMLLTIINYFL